MPRRPFHSLTRWLPGLLALLSCLTALPALAQSAAAPPAAGDCGNPFQNHFGPWDFRSARREDIEIVEKYHFTPGVESMTKPATSTYAAMASDVAYTLHVFPNHHRALITMMRLGERHKTDMPPGAARSVDCYFRRAVVFRPDDTVVRGIYALYLHKNKRHPEALQQLAYATEKAGDNPMSHYTLGAVYFDLGEFDLAVTQAQRAQALGYPRPDLETALRAAGKWQDAAPAVDEAASAASQPAR